MLTYVPGGLRRKFSLSTWKVLSLAVLDWAELILESPELSTLPKPCTPCCPGGTNRHEVKTRKEWELWVCDQESCFTLGLSVIWTIALPFEQGDRVFICNFRNNTTCIQKGWTWHRISMMAHGWSGRAAETIAFCKSFYKANYTLHNCCEQPWCLHDPLRSFLANAHLPQLSQRNQPNSDLTSPHPHRNGCGFIWIWMRSGPGPGSTGTVKVGVWSCTQIPASMLVMQAVNPFKTALP